MRNFADYTSEDLHAESKIAISEGYRDVNCLVGVATGRVAGQCRSIQENNTARCTRQCIRSFARYIMSSWLQNQFKAAEGLLEAVDRTAKNVSKKEVAEQRARGAEESRSDSFTAGEVNQTLILGIMRFESSVENGHGFGAGSRRASSRKSESVPTRPSPAKVLCEHGHVKKSLERLKKPYLVQERLSCLEVTRQVAFTRSQKQKS